MPGYQVTQIADGRTRLEYLLYDGVGGLSVISSLAGDIPLAYLQYEGGTKDAVVAAVIQGSPYKLTLRPGRPGTSSRRLALHFDLAGRPNLRPLTSTVAVDVSMRFTVGDASITQTITQAENLEVVGRYMEIAQRQLPPLRAAAINVPAAGNGSSAANTYKHNYAGREVYFVSTISGSEVSIPALSNVQVIIATISGTGGGGTYRYNLVGSSASGNPFAQLGGTAGNVLYYAKEPPNGVLRFDIEVADSQAQQVGVRNQFQPSIITLTFYVQNNSPARTQPFSVSVAMQNTLQQSILLECLGAVAAAIEAECLPLVSQSTPSAPNVPDAPQYAVTLSDGTLLGVYDDARNPQLTLVRVLGFGDVAARYALNISAENGADDLAASAVNPRDYALVATPRDYPAAVAQRRTLNVVAQNWLDTQINSGEILRGVTVSATALSGQQIILLSRNIYPSVSVNAEWRGPVAQIVEGGNSIILATLENDPLLGGERFMAARIVPRGGVGGGALGAYRFSLIAAGSNFPFLMGAESGDVSYGARSTAGDYVMTIVVSDVSGVQLSRLTRDATLIITVRLIREADIAGVITRLLLWRANTDASTPSTITDEFNIGNFYDNQRNASCGQVLGCEWTFIGNMQAGSASEVIPHDFLQWQTSAGLTTRAATVLLNSQETPVQELWFAAQTEYDTFGALTNTNLNIRVWHDGNATTLGNYTARWRRWRTRATVAPATTSGAICPGGNFPFHSHL